MRKFITFLLRFLTYILPFAGLFILGVLLYGMTIRGMYGKPDIATVKDRLDLPTYPFELSPERGRYATLVALAEDHTFALREELGQLAYPDVGVYKNRFYSYFAPGISILAYPLYNLGLTYNIPQVAAYSVVAMFAVLNLLCLYYISRYIFKFPLWAALFAPILFGFGTPSWSYAITLYQHHATTFFILATLIASWKIRQGSATSALWAAYAWFNYGYGIFVDYPNALLMAPVMAYLTLAGFGVKLDDAKKTLGLAFRPEVFIGVIMFIAITVGHAYYNGVNFGSWTRVSGSLPGYKSIVEANLTQTEDAEKKVEERKGQKNIVKFFTEEKTPFGFYTLTISQDRGIFLYVPIMVLAVFGSILAMRTMTPEIGTLLSSIAINLFLYSSWGDPWGGWAFGPRYLIPTMAMGSLFVSYFLAHTRFSVLWRVVALILFVYSSAVAILGAFTTNAVPPKIEGDFLHIAYNFIRNLDFYLAGKSGSFVFNHYLSPYVTLGQLTAVIFGGLFAVAFVLLILFPLLKRKKTV